VHWLERAASAGLALPSTASLPCYERGQGVAKDVGKARSWYAATAEKGSQGDAKFRRQRPQSDKADYALAVK
jgi:TPR repeat protein